MAVIHRVEIQLADIDRGVYGDYPLTIAQHPSETDQRLMIRLLAFALNVPADGDHGPLELARDLWETDAASLWQKDYTGRVVHWIDVGEPSEKRLLRVTARVDRMSVYAYSSTAAEWFRQLGGMLSRVRNLSLWQVTEEQTAELAKLVQRTMELQVTVQDGAVWVGDGKLSVEATPVRLWGASA